MEEFIQMNMFARICTIVAYLIIGCATCYPIIDKLHYLP